MQPANRLPDERDTQLAEAIFNVFCSVPTTTTTTTKVCWVGRWRVVWIATTHKTASCKSSCRRLVNWVFPFSISHTAAGCHRGHGEARWLLQFLLTNYTYPSYHPCSRGRLLYADLFFFIESCLFVVGWMGKRVYRKWVLWMNRFFWIFFFQIRRKMRREKTNTRHTQLLSLSSRTTTSRDSGVPSVVI